MALKILFPRLKPPINKVYPYIATSLLYFKYLYILDLLKNKNSYMAKKKRKHFIKLNNKIKSLFNNRPFDEVIVEFDDDILYGLLMLLDANIGTLERNDIIKFIRRVWSEADYSKRKLIVDFIEDQFAYKKNQKQDKVELILSFLEDIDTTPQEDEQILLEFMDKKVSKITKDKVLNKLAYIKMSKILKSYSKKLNIAFVGDRTIEFSYPQIITIDNIELEINIIHTKKLDISLNQLVQYEQYKAIEYLNNLKNLSIEETKKDVQKFNNTILNIKYFKTKELIDIFKSIKEPIRNLYHSPIPSKIVKKVIKSLDKFLNINYNVINYLISKEFTYNLFGEEIKYDIYIDYDKKTIYSSIWTNNISLISDGLNRTNMNTMVHFESFINELKLKLIDSFAPLEIDENRIKEYILRFILPVVESNRSLKLKNKIANRVLYHFNEEIKPLKDKYKRQELLANTIRDFKQLFPVARSLNREIIFNVGPTNSGKTYSALQELKSAETGFYLAPLRLLALEGYEDLKKNGVNCSLITGEEEIIDEDSTHISSTIEMLNTDIEVDVCVIDEIQMIGDRDRGWAWANALIGAPAKKVILTGSNDALNVVKEIAKYLEEKLTIVEFERKNPLKVMERATPINKLKQNTAIVTFSRKEVLALKNKVAPFFDVSVVYGNLSPEVRREEARRFREGESQILIATDAIAMGLNLPIKTILFARDNKFDGFKRRQLTSSEVLQISGRAGRYGLHESGFVGALDHPTLVTIREKFNKKLSPISLPISVMASLDHILLIGEILQTQILYEILNFFASNMEFEGPFLAANIDSMMQVAKIVDEYSLDLVSKYHLACAPVSINSPYLEKTFHRYLKLLENDKIVPFNELKNVPKKAMSFSALLNAEDRVKEVSLYLWLSFKFSDKFLDTDIAKETREKLNRYIEKSLREATFSKECRICGKELDLNYRFSICDKCYNRQKRGYKKRKSTS